MMISSHRAGSPTFTNKAHWWRCCDAITQIFTLASKSQLGKSDFAAYRQESRDDVSAYLLTKFALYDAAYGVNEGDFDILFNSVIDVLYNQEVKYQLEREYPRTREEVIQTLVRIVASERRAFDHGYGRSETEDSLFHTTIFDHKRHGQPGEEAMDISEMKKEIRNMEEETNPTFGATNANVTATLWPSARVIPYQLVATPMKGKLIQKAYATNAISQNTKQLIAERDKRDSKKKEK